MLKVNEVSLDEDQMIEAIEFYLNEKVFSDEIAVLNVVAKDSSQGYNKKTNYVVQLGEVDDLEEVN